MKGIEREIGFRTYLELELDTERICQELRGK